MPAAYSLAKRLEKTEHSRGVMSKTKKLSKIIVKRGRVFALAFILIYSFKIGNLGLKDNVIKKKRDGNELEAEEINYFIESVVNGTATDAQIGAWLMAVYLNGMNDRETLNLTKAMMESGRFLQWNDSWKGLLVDKHSTGGVGDKVSLILAPVLASCGLKVPMLSGRGLGLTGGTLDKLESIPGFQVLLTYDEMYDCLDKVGCFIAGQTDSVATADKILYKQRDLTNTVGCKPLIISSILSKKAAEGIEELVMDIKVGSGALIEDEKEAIEFADKLFKVSKGLNIDTTAILSDMNTPIGRYVGNSLEVIESVECLQDRGSEDIKHLVKVLGGILLQKKGITKTSEEGQAKVQENLSNKAALNKFRDMIIYQGVSEEIANDLCNRNFSKVFPNSKYVTKLKAEKGGFINAIIARDIARACWYLGSGRSSPEGSIDYTVGVKLLKSLGEKIEAGEEWIEVHHSEHKVNKNTMDLIKNSLITESVKGIKKERILRIC